MAGFEVITEVATKASLNGTSMMFVCWLCGGCYEILTQNAKESWRPYLTAQAKTKKGRWGTAVFRGRAGSS
jgi:hypothetical protein